MKRFLKIFTLIALLSGLAAPFSVLAQRNDSWIYYDTEIDDRADFAETWGQLSILGFGQQSPSPLGSGFLIMTAAGAGYALLKRKKEEKL